MSRAKIWIGAEVRIDDLAANLCAENGYEDLIKLVRAIDAQQQDWLFTYKLKDLIDELMEEPR